MGDDHDLGAGHPAAPNPAHLASFPEMNPFPVTEVDLEGYVLYSNPAADRLIPDLRERRLDHPWLSAWREVVADCGRDPACPIQREVQIGPTWYQQALYRVPGENVIRIYGVDVTARRKAEAELQQREAFLEAIVENIPDMIFVKEAKELRFVRFNRAAESLLGVSRDDLYGRNDFDLFPKTEAEFFVGRDREVLASGGVLDIPEEPIHTRVLGTRILHTKKLPVRDAAGQPVYLMGISEDITERKLKEDELARSNRELELFAYVASHDLQEPLRMVASYVQLLARRFGTLLDDDGRQFVRFAVEGAQRAQQLIDGLLEFSRVGTAGQPLAPVDAGIAVGKALANLTIALKDAEARVDIAPLPAVLGDESQLVQLFQNLIGNAVKFRGGEPPVVEVSAHRDGAWWEFGVRDNGIGIAPEYTERIFVIFQRLHGREAYPGNGLGLALVKKIVERHGGRIRVDSEVGKGSTFRFTLRDAGTSPER